MARFFIRAKKNGGTNLFARIRNLSLGLDFDVNTGILVNVEEWNKATKSKNKKKAWDDYSRDNKVIIAKLHDVEGVINDLLSNNVTDKQKYVTEIRNVVLSDVREKQEKERQRIEAARIKAKQEQQAARLNVLNYYKEFYEGICNGDIKHGKDEAYSTGSIRVWKEFGNYLTDFCSGKHITFETIDKKVADKFSKFLEVDKGLMPKTVLKYVICFRRLCNSAAETGINRNAVSLKCWKERKIKDSVMKAQTYLNEEELQALYDMPLTGLREKVRDMFMLGTLLCQRYSDFMNLYKDNFAKPLDDGTQCCRLTQQKTNSDVVIPLYDSRMAAICKKYDYKFPHNREITGEGKGRYLIKNDSNFTLQAFNRYIKDIMNELSMSVPSLNDMFVTVLTAGERRREDKYRSEHGGKDLYQRNERGEVIKAKWDIITAHSARRSGITCLYNKHILSNREIMQISGHSSELIFEHYIRVGADEAAKNINDKLRKG